MIHKIEQLSASVAAAALPRVQHVKSAPTRTASVRLGVVPHAAVGGRRASEQTALVWIPAPLLLSWAAWPLPGVSELPFLLNQGQEHLSHGVGERIE